MKKIIIIIILLSYLTLYGLSSQYWYNKAVKLKDNQLKIEYLSKAINLDPQFDFAYAGRGLAYYSDKNYTKAISDLNKAIKINPESAIYYYNRGIIFSAKENYNKSLNDFNSYLLKQTSDDDPGNTTRVNGWINQIKEVLKESGQYIDDANKKTTSNNLQSSEIISPVIEETNSPTQSTEYDFSNDSEFPSNSVPSKSSQNNFFRDEEDMDITNIKITSEPEEENFDQTKTNTFTYKEPIREEIDSSPKKINVEKLPISQVNHLRLKKTTRIEPIFLRNKQVVNLDMKKSFGSKRIFLSDTSLVMKINYFLDNYPKVVNNLKEFVITLTKFRKLPFEMRKEDIVKNRGYVDNLNDLGYFPEQEAKYKNTIKNFQMIYEPKEKKEINVFLIRDETTLLITQKNYSDIFYDLYIYTPDDFFINKSKIRFVKINKNRNQKVYNGQILMVYEK